MHLKNFSLITRGNRVEFSPAYDLLNTTMVLGRVEEEMALMLDGKRKEFSRRELVDYFGKEKLGLTEVAIQEILQALFAAQAKWEELIGISFLAPKEKTGYLKILQERFRRLNGLIS